MARMPDEQFEKLYPLACEFLGGGGRIMYELVRARAVEAAITAALKDYFAPAPPIGCGSGRDDHECQRCRDTYAAHEQWQTRRAAAERVLRDSARAAEMAP